MRRIFNNAKRSTFYNTLVIYETSFFQIALLITMIIIIWFVYTELKIYVIYAIVRLFIFTEQFLQECFCCICRIHRNVEFQKYVTMQILLIFYNILSSMTTSIFYNTTYVLYFCNFNRFPIEFFKVLQNCLLRAMTTSLTNFRLSFVCADSTWPPSASGWAT